MARLLATARTSVAVRQTAEVVALKIRSLVRQLTMLDQEIADLDHAIAEPFGQLGYRPADFPAGGVVALATLVAEAGPIERYPTAKHFVAYFGWCPVDRQRVRGERSDGERLLGPSHSASGRCLVVRHAHTQGEVTDECVCLPSDQLAGAYFAHRLDLVSVRERNQAAQEGERGRRYSHPGVSIAVPSIGATVACRDPMPVDDLSSGTRADRLHDRQPLCDPCLVTVELGRDLRVGKALLLFDLSETLGDFERRQIGADDILDERVEQMGAVVCGGDQGWDQGQVVPTVDVDELVDGAEAPLTSSDRPLRLWPGQTRRSHGDRREQASTPDGLDQIVHLATVQNLARLLGVSLDIVDVDQAKDGPAKTLLAIDRPSGVLRPTLVEGTRNR